MNSIVQAAHQIDQALEKLELAKLNLSQAQIGQRIRLFMVVEELKEIRDILTDPECTPEIVVGR